MKLEEFLFARSVAQCYEATGVSRIPGNVRGISIPVKIFCGCMLAQHTSRYS